MRLSYFPGRAFSICTTLAFCAVLAAGGCNKPKGSSSSSVAVTEVAWSVPDLNADGTIGSSAIKWLDAHAQDPAVSIGFIRTNLSDAGLVQLAKYPNIRHVAAVNSRITAQGIAKLKQVNPVVEVIK